MYCSKERPETVKLGCWGGYHKKITIRHFFWDTLYFLPYEAPPLLFLAESCRLHITAPVRPDFHSATFPLGKAKFLAKLPRFSISHVVNFLDCPVDINSFVLSCQSTIIQVSTCNSLFWDSSEIIRNLLQSYKILCWASCNPWRPRETISSVACC